MNKYFETLKKQSEIFKLFVSSYNMESSIEGFSTSTKNSLAEVIYELAPDEYVSKLEMNQMGGYFSIFAKLKNEGGIERYCHCGSTLVKEEAERTLSEMKTFFETLYN